MAPLYQVFVCKTHVFPLPNSGDAFQKKMSQPIIKAKMRDSGEDIEGISKARYQLMYSGFPTQSTETQS